MSTRGRSGPVSESHEILLVHSNDTRSLQGIDEEPLKGRRGYVNLSKTASSNKPTSALVMEDLRYSVAVTGICLRIAGNTVPSTSLLTEEIITTASSAHRDSSESV